MKNKNASKTKKNGLPKFLDLKNIDRTTEAAVYYGFIPMETPSLEKEDLQKAKTLKDGEPMPLIGTNFEVKNLPEEKAAILRTYLNTNLAIMPQPVMVAFDSFIEEGGKKSKGKSRKIDLEILGSPKSISEAILIKTAFAILADNDIKDLYVDINSIGDKESYSRYVRELTAYYRKNLNTMQAHCRQALKKDAFAVLTCQNEKCCLLKDNAPKSISCLSDSSRQHFKEVLEYLETLNIPYRINDCLISDRRYASQTIFEIKQKSENTKHADPSLAIGFRYDSIGKKIGFKKDVPAVGLKLSFRSASDKNQIPKIKRSSVFFLQLGDEAKHKSLQVIDILRQSDIYINHSLSRDKLGSQMALAERSKVPYILIMGKKEAMDNTIMIRDTATRSQETVAIKDLAAHLNRLFK
ncbi:MAG: His/Gly/Thr/Pro-type tRNA ligase C-terminal domain-containing protein [bacterium]